MGRKRKQRKESSSEEDSDSSREESSSDKSEPKESSSPKHRKRQTDRDTRGKTKDTQQDRNIERSRWESPDAKKRKHISPSSQNQQRHQLGREERRRGHRERPDASEAKTKWDKNDKDREVDRDSEKRRNESDREDNRSKNGPDNHRRREPPDRDFHRETRTHERPNRNDNRENRHNESQRQDERFENRRHNDRNSPRRKDEREKRNRNFNGRNNNERGRRGGRGNRFGNNDGPRSRFDGSRVKSEPSPEWGRPDTKDEKDSKPVEKEKPNFEPSGKLTEDANTVNGVVIKYTEPLESRKPKRRWRLYPFKGEKALPTLYVHRQSAYLMGRDRKVADIPLDHPSCSKQHAALQFRLVPFQREDGGEGKRVRPYLIDLESANGTFVNDIKLEPRRYHELLERDVLRFGFSSREYVLLHEQSKDDALDDDVEIPAVAPK